MLNYIRRHVWGMTALFVALGGTSYAAFELPAHSVGAKQLKNHAVTPPKIAPSAQTALKGNTGAAGPPGPTASAFGTVAGASVTPSTTDQTVIDTGTSASATHSGPIKVTFPARLEATATVTAFKNTLSDTKIGELDCHIDVGSGGTFVQISQLATTTFEPTVATDPVFREIPVVGSANVVPGTYTVRVQCRQPVLDAAHDGTLEFSNAALNVIAAAR